MEFVLNLDKHWDKHRSLDQNMNDLKRKLENLNSLMEDAESRMRAQLQPRKKLKKEVQLWLGNVERINDEVQNLEQGVQESCVVLLGFQAKLVLKKIQEVEELLQQGKFQDGSVVDEPQCIGQALSTTTLVGESAKVYMQMIWQSLMDGEIQKIGVCGMGGVGKTALMKVINNQLLKQTNKFDVVIWVTVSKEMSSVKLQKDIARKLNVTLSEDEDEKTRAGMLSDLLAQKGRFVIILDDVWEKFSLERVGIPETSKGSKLLLTTRSFDVCRCMGCRVINMKPLAEEDAWDLFLKRVGSDILNYPDLKPFIKSVAKHCAGLPLAIITIASSMKGIYDLYEWRNAHKELTSCVKSVNGFESEIFHQLQFSYNHLKDPKLQHCFLSCALYPEDCETPEVDLISLWIAEGLVEEMGTRQAELDRGRSMLNRLINSCLLETVQIDSVRCLKMHDLVRDMALCITSVRPRFLVKASLGLTKLPDAQEWSEDLEKVSLMENYMLQISSEIMPPKCPILTTLLLSDCAIDSIPESFFQKMPQLKILDLSWNPIEELPSSISKLQNLTRLLLHNCACLEEVPSLSKLGALKELDLEAIDIKAVPSGMEKLINLKYLNLKWIQNLEEIPTGILSNLSCLQCLLIG
ncbi:hypothetical protein PTKIN_Ptkin14bG0118500 [Pterospermum kingtungense]